MIPDNLSPLPAVFADAIRARQAKQAEQARPIERTSSVPDADKLKRAQAYADKVDGAISGSGGHDNLWRLTLALVRGFELDEADTYNILAGAYNDRCQPPWSEKELRHKIKQASNARLPSGWLLVDKRKPARGKSISAAPTISSWESLLATVPEPSQDPEQIFSPGADREKLRAVKHSPGVEEWRETLRGSYNEQTGVTRVYSDIDNLALILTKDPAWTGVLGYDLFAGRLAVRRPPPFARRVDKNGAWTDGDDVEALCWFLRSPYFFTAKPTLETLRGAVLVAAERAAFHPLRDRLNALPAWDEVPRLDTWLTDFLGAANDTYTQSVGRCMLIAAIARVFDPGCQCDYMVVLEGDQGIRKSSTLRELAFEDEWFSNQPGEIGSKESYERLCGRWIVEIAELDAMRHAEASTIKDFLTTRTDKFRPAYGRYVVERPRQCVFFGSVNPGANGYLKDDTGNRRFWPVACGKEIVNIELVRAAREQLWAEAMHAYRSGVKWYLDQDVEAVAEEKQEERAHSDTWETTIGAWVNKRLYPVSVEDVLTDCLGITIRDIEKKHEMRAANCLKRLGYVNKRETYDGVRKMWWRKEI